MKPIIAGPVQGGRTIIKGWAGLSRKTGRSRTQNWRDVRTGRLPAPFELGANSVAWWEDEVDANLAARPRRHYGAPEAE
jgi:predicted DNA-binding transcriptional regulator AlpA